MDSGAGARRPAGRAEYGDGSGHLRPVRARYETAAVSADVVLVIAALAWVKGLRRGPAEKRTLDADRRERLRRLGYVE